MTQFNQIGEFGLGQVLTRRLTTPGGTNAPSVAPEVFPTLTLESDRPEWGFLKGEQMAGGYTTAAAGGAGVASAARLYNPWGSGLIMTVHSISAEAAATRCVYAISRGATVGLAPAGSLSSAIGPRDARWGVTSIGVRQPSGQILADNANVPVVASAWFKYLGFIPIVTPIVAGAWVLGPGDHLYVRPATSNLALDHATFVWSERGAQPGELA